MRCNIKVALVMLAIWFVISHLAIGHLHIFWDDTQPVGSTPLATIADIAVDNTSDNVTTAVVNGGVAFANAPVNTSKTHERHNNEYGKLSNNKAAPPSDADKKANEVAQETSTDKQKSHEVKGQYQLIDAAIKNAQSIDQN